MIVPFVLAQAAAAALPAVAPPQSAVTAFPAAFFAATNPSTALDMINRVPGFTLDTGASVRGFEGAGGNVLIDGQRPASKSDSVDEVLLRIAAGQVERIDIIRGGAPGIDMQGKAVLANVIRKAGAGVRGLVAASTAIVKDDGRVAPSVRLEASGGSGDRTWEASLRSGRGIDDGSGPGPEVKTDALGQPLAIAQVRSAGAGVQTTAAGSFEIPLLGGRFRANGRYFQNNYDFDETDTFSLPALAVSTDHIGDDEADTEIGGRFSRDLGRRFNVEFVGLRTTKAETFADTFIASPGGRVDFTLDRYSTETIARGVLKFRQSERLSWEAGAETAYNDLDSRTRLSRDGAPIVLPSANVQVRETRWEAFGKAVWRPTDALTLEAALRQEGSALTSQGDVRLSKSLAFTKPRLAASWSPSPAWQVRLSLEREIGQLNFDDFVAKSSLSTSTVTAGNPNLNPEQAWVSEAAIERRFWGSGSVVVSVRHSSLTDAIDRAPISPGSTFDSPANIGQGVKTEYAVELTAPLDRMGLAGAQLKGFVRRRVSQVTDPTTGRAREISGLRPLSWEAHYSQGLPRWQASWGVDVFGAWRQTYYRADVIEVQNLKTYVVPYFEWKPRPDLQLRIEVQNATERGFRNTRTVYDGPRSLDRVALVDDRDIQFGRIFYIRVRKTFGA
ncbi:TonB-dependent receptor domain-containing protein [Phenylobacterium sp.]|uniref:TonB-dependent receptor plug domain-containing protein n=1 Tax=Phenylobacterium sp. TaxID=1871053 RepID=UPI00286AB186|nr:TonB-dependent receptor [Phenylobacterium sp.]